MKPLVSVLIALWSALPLLAQTPEWIWFRKTDHDETRFFRKSFNLESAVTSAELMASADDGLDVFVNGQKALSANEWSTPHRADVKARLKVGRNVIAIRAVNADSSPAGALARLTLSTAAGKWVLVSDATWKAEDRELAGWTQVAFDDAAWPTAESLGKLGVAPWGNILERAVAPARQTVRSATPAEELYTIQGFEVELLQSGGPEDGSWVNMCKDDRGRLIVSPQYGARNTNAGLLRFTLGAEGKITKRDMIARPLYDAQGMVFANGALWVVVNKYTTEFESGLYRVTDDGSDSWNQIKLVKKLPGGGEHGPHAVELGPDGNLWVLAGNHTRPPSGVATDSPHRNYQEDHALPRQPDGNGHATGIMAPGGYICRVTPDGEKWELFCGGFRNPFDFTFNSDGELFVFDADMEWDWGMPWYRATRINHAVSGAEFGWRYGTGKWPDYYADSVGSVVDIGIGCPTGVSTGKGAKFPAKYQKALYAMDWTYGRLMAVHLTPDGASYSGTWENFVAPAGLVEKGKSKPPLNVTDLVIGQDGALYFVIGGRDTAAGLYRVTYTGAESTAPSWTPNSTGAEARALRRKLESYHGKMADGAVEFLWPHLDSPDRSLRYAARVALEAQPLSTWQERALAEKSADGGLTALLALARVGGASVQPELWRALSKWPLGSLVERQQLDKLRALQVSIARHGLPSADLAGTAIAELDPQYPSGSGRVNRELSQVLIGLRAPEVVGKTLGLMRNAKTQEDVMHYLFHLRTAKHWSLDQRKEYFAYWTADRKGFAHQGATERWFAEAGRPYADGASFNNFLKNFLKEAEANLDEHERSELGPVLASIETPAPARKVVSRFPLAQKREFVKNWTMVDFGEDLNKLGKRNFGRGKQAFVDAQCIACHRMGNEGGGVGPDLTAVNARFKRVDILESILDPSKVLSEQFQNTSVFLKNGDDVTGRLVDETPEELVLIPNQLEPGKKVAVKKAEVAERRASKISPMPAGLADVFTRDELLDLVGFLEAGGQEDHFIYKK